MSTTEALTKPARPIRTALLVGGTAALLVVGGLGVGSMATAQSSGQARSMGEEVVYVELTPANQPVDSQETQAAVDAQEAAIAQAAADAAAAAQAAAEAAAQAAAQQQAAQQSSGGGSGSSGGLPAGSPVPNRPDGSPDTSACASSSASFVGGVVVCD